MVRDHSLGGRGELKAQEYLIAEGYVILETNYTAPSSEIDIIARDGKVLAFIEIKTRSTTACGFPAEAIDVRKQKKIIAAARHYLSTHHVRGDEYRFDVVEVLYDFSSQVVQEITLMRDAFECGDDT